MTASYDALHRVREAVAARFDPDNLADEERPYYYDLLGEALANPTPAEVAAMAAIGSEPGAVGYNDAGQLVRVRKDGSEEILEVAGDDGDLSA